MTNVISFSDRKTDGCQMTLKEYEYDFYSTGRFLLIKAKTEYRGSNGKLVDPPRFASVMTSQKIRHFYLIEIDWEVMKMSFPQEYSTLVNQLIAARKIAPVQSTSDEQSIENEVILLNATSP